MSILAISIVFGAVLAAVVCFAVAFFAALRIFEK
jgi:hypothetical protein